MTVREGRVQRLGTLCVAVGAALAVCLPAIATKAASVPATLPTDSVCTSPTPQEGTAPSGGAAGLGPTPAGVVAFQILNPAAEPFKSLFTDSSMSGNFNGVDLLAEWCNLEPHKGQFNWLPLDQLFQEATVAHKFVILTLIPGFTTPRWVFKQSPSIPLVTSSFSYGTPDKARELPQPWNKTYLNRWYAFLAQVAARYGQSPAFRGIAAGGPTSVSTEMSLPNWPSPSYPGLDTGLPSTLSGSVVPLDENDLTMWETWGYTPQKLVGAWAAVFRHYYELFPDQYVMLALYPGLGIGDDGKPDPSQGVATPLATVSAAVHAEGTSAKHHFVLMEDGIAGTPANPTDPMYNIVKSGCSRAVTAYQDAITMQASLLGNALANVTSGDVAFWEVNVNDFISSESAVLQQANVGSGAALPASSACAPLELTTSTDSSGGPTLTLRTNLDFDNSGLQINLFEGGRQFSLPCTTTTAGETCTGNVSAGTYTADIGEPGTKPYTAQALASAKVGVTHVGPICKKGKACG